MIKKILALLVLIVGMTTFFGPKLIFGQEENINLPEVIITGEDKSIFKEEERSKPGKEKAIEELSKEAQKEVFSKERQEKSSQSEKEKLKEEEKREEEKEKRFTSSSFTLSYGTFETLFYEHLFGQQTRPMNYLLKMRPGNRSSGFSLSHDERVFDEYNRSAFDLEAKIRSKEKIGLEGSFGFYEEKRALPYLSSDFDAKKALGINFSLGGKLFLSSMTELAFKGTFSENSFSLLLNEREKQEDEGQIVGADLRLNTLWKKKFPISLTARVFQEKFKQEYQASSIYIEANRLKKQPVVINAKVGWDHRDKNPSISKAGFAVEVLCPYHEKALFFVHAKKSLNNPTSTTLYLKKDYVWISEELVSPEEILDISLGASYRLGALSLITLTLFGKEVKDFIVWEDSEDTDPRLFKPVNIKGGKARFRGATCELKHHLGKELIYQAKYTYTETENKDEEKVVPHTPEQYLLTSLTYAGKRDYEIVLSYELVSSRYSKENFKEKDLPAYSLLSLRMSKGITDSLNLFLEGRNLLNEDKAYKLDKSYPLRGREIEVGVKVKF